MYFSSKTEFFGRRAAKGLFKYDVIIGVIVLHF